jgi:hypothetical protein
VGCCWCRFLRLVPVTTCRLTRFFTQGYIRRRLRFLRKKYIPRYLRR